MLTITQNSKVRHRRIRRGTFHKIQYEGHPIVAGTTPLAQELSGMAIKRRAGREEPWEVYWNNPSMLKHESLYIETEEEAEKQDAFKKFQLKYERDFLWREEAEAPQVEHIFESMCYLLLKDKQLSERSLERHLRNMRHLLVLLKGTPLSDIDNTKLKQLTGHFLSFGIKASILKRCIRQVFSIIHWVYQNELLCELPRIPKLPPYRIRAFHPSRTARACSGVCPCAGACPESCHPWLVNGNACKAVRVVWLDVIRCGLGKQGDTPTRHPKEQERACQGYSNQAISHGGIEGIAGSR